MILFRYLAAEVLKSVVAVTIALLAIIMSGRFVKFLAQAASGDFAPEVLFIIMLYRLPSFLEVVLPLGLFISILLSYGRLYVDSEMTVMNACGMSRRRMLLYTQIPAFFIALIVAYISMVVTPDGIRASREKLADSRAEIGVEATVEGRFRLDKSSGRVTYIESVDRNTQSMKAVFVAQPEPVQENGRSLVSIITAQNGVFQVDEEHGEKRLILEKGVRYVGQPGYMDYQRTRFDGLSQLFLQPEIKTYRQELDGKPTSELWGSDRLEDIAVLQWRISLSLLVPVAALIAMSLSKTDHRRGRYGKMFPAFMLYMIYLVALNASRDAIAKGDWPPMPGMWAIHFAFFSLGILLLYRDSIYRHWWLAWRRRRG
ncbi:LPS export ABC transporter permease LptF [Spongiibacter sp. KMU-158]|uniref:Lipopolysaccharide export system permease protein LptF n=1 Tax=Spongiibacter pelagi TaxID=2760804 RepID=A0A927C193_9GAMM|nr:LPS export ABC transporter permease LptF [Spongiibacter pelagi]MBD2858172.1 LPS export ABC transporter permease LptF [Spongiibacter pelagi]